MADQPYDYRTMSDMFNLAKNEGSTQAPDLKTFATQLSTATGKPELFRQGVNDNWIKQASTGIDRGLTASGFPQGLGAVGRAILSPFGEGDVGQSAGEGLPRAVVNFLPLVASGLVSGGTIPAALGIAGAGALAGSQAYTETGSPAAGVIAGVGQGLFGELPGGGSVVGKLGDSLAGEGAGAVKQFLSHQVAAQGVLEGQGELESKASGQGFYNPLNPQHLISSLVNQAPFLATDLVRLGLGGHVPAPTTEDKIATALGTPETMPEPSVVPTLEPEKEIVPTTSAEPVPRTTEDILADAKVGPQDDDAIKRATTLFSQVVQHDVPLPPEEVGTVKVGEIEAAEKIKAAALQYDDGKVFTGPTHALAFDAADQNGYEENKNVKSGFVTSTGRFVNDKEAQQIAEANKQTNKIGAPALDSSSLKPAVDPVVNAAVPVTDAETAVAKVQNAQEVQKQVQGPIVTDEGLGKQLEQTLPIVSGDLTEATKRVTQAQANDAVDHSEVAKKSRGRPATPQTEINSAIGALDKTKPEDSAVLQTLNNALNKNPVETGGKASLDYVRKVQSATTGWLRGYTAPDGTVIPPRDGGIQKLQGNLNRVLDKAKSPDARQVTIASGTDEKALREQAKTLNNALPSDTNKLHSVSKLRVNDKGEQVFRLLRYEKSIGVGSAGLENVDEGVLKQPLPPTTEKLVTPPTELSPEQQQAVTGVKNQLVTATKNLPDSFFEDELPAKLGPDFDENNIPRTDVLRNRVAALMQTSVNGEAPEAVNVNKYLTNKFHQFSSDGAIQQFIRGDVFSAVRDHVLDTVTGRQRFLGSGGQRGRIAAGSGLDFGLQPMDERGRIGKHTISKEGVVSEKWLKDNGGTDGLPLTQGEVDLYKKLVPGAFKAGAVDYKELLSGLEKNEPVVETKTLGDAANAAAKGPALQAQHELETRGYQVTATGIKDENGRAVSPNMRHLTDDVRDLIRKAEDIYNHTDTDSAQYSSLGPKAGSDMPGYVEGLVRLPQPNTEARIRANLPPNDTAPASHYPGPHFGSEDKNVLAFYRGYEETLPDGTKAFHVIEVQSDWGQAHRKAVDTNKAENAKGGIQRDLPAEPHLLLRDDVWKSLALKAAIAHAQEVGATKIILSDGETAMMTEGHDKAGQLTRTFTTEAEANQFKKSLGSDYDGLITTEGNKLIGNSYNEPSRQGLLSNGFENELKQNAGMRLHYDTALPSAMKKLTGDGGERVELPGVHDKASDQLSTINEADRNFMQREVTEGRMTQARMDQLTGEQPRKGSPVFRNPDGTPKSNITGRMYDISKLSPRATKLFGAQGQRGEITPLTANLAFDVAKTVYEKIKPLAEQKQDLLGQITGSDYGLSKYQAKFKEYEQKYDEWKRSLDGVVLRLPADQTNSLLQRWQNQEPNVKAELVTHDLWRDVLIRIKDVAEYKQTGKHSLGDLEDIFGYDITKSARYLGTQGERGSGSVNESVTVQAYRGVGKMGTNSFNVDGRTFWSSKENVARQYGANVKREELTLNNPLKTDNWFTAKIALGLAKSATMSDVLAAAEKSGHDSIIWQHHGETEYVKLRPQSGSLAEPNTEQQGLFSVKSLGDQFFKDMLPTERSAATKYMMQSLARWKQMDVKVGELVKNPDSSTLGMAGIDDTTGAKSVYLANLMKSESVTDPTKVMQYNFNHEIVHHIIEDIKTKPTAFPAELVQAHSDLDGLLQQATPEEHLALIAAMGKTAGDVVSKEGASRPDRKVAAEETIANIGAHLSARLAAADSGWFHDMVTFLPKPVGDFLNQASKWTKRIADAAMGIVGLGDKGLVQPSRLSPRLRKAGESFTAALKSYAKASDQIQKDVNAFMQMQNFDPVGFSVLQQAANVNPLFESGITFDDAPKWAKEAKDDFDVANALVPERGPLAKFGNAFRRFFLQQHISAMKYSFTKPAIEVPNKMRSQLELRTMELQALNAMTVLPGGNMVHDEGQLKRNLAITTGPRYQQVFNDIFLKRREINGEFPDVEIDKVLAKTNLSDEEKEDVKNVANVTWGQTRLVADKNIESQTAKGQTLNAMQLIQKARADGGDLAIPQARQVADYLARGVKMIQDPTMARDGENLLNAARSLLGNDEAYNSGYQFAQAERDRVKQLQDFYDTPQQSRFTSEQRPGPHQASYTDKNGKVGRIGAETPEDLRRVIRKKVLEGAKDFKYIDKTTGQGVYDAPDGAMDVIARLEQEQMQDIQKSDLFTPEQLNAWFDSESITSRVAKENLAKNPTMPGTKAKLGGTPGREEIPMLQNQQRYLSSALLAMGKSQARAELGLELMAPEYAQRPDLRDERIEHFNAVLTPDGAVSRTLTKVNFYNYLAFSPATSLTISLHAGMSHLPMLVHDGAGYVQAPKLQLEAAKDIAKWATNGYKWDNLEYDALMRSAAQDIGKSAFGDLFDKEENRTIIQTARMKDGLPVDDGIFKKPLSKLDDVSKVLFRSSAAFNSRMALLAGYKLARARGIEPLEAQEYAKDFNNRANFVGGKYNRPTGLLKPFGPTAGHLLYSLNSFNWGMIGTAAHYIEGTFKGNTNDRRALVTMLGTQLLAGGAIGLPGAGIAIALLEKAFPTLQLHKAIVQNVRDLAGDDDQMGGLVSNTALHGVLNQMGIDAADRVTFGHSFLGANSYDGYDPAQIMGPTVNIFRNMAQGVTDAAQGKMLAAATDVAPNIIKRTLQLYTGDGAVRSRTGQLLMEPSMGQKFASLIGFTPSAVSDLREAQQIQFRAQQVRNLELSDATQKASQALVQGDTNTARQLMQQYGESDPTFDPAAGLRAVAERATAYDAPKDIVGSGQQMTSAVDTLQQRQNYEQQLGLPGKMSTSEYLQAFMTDQLRQTNPTMTSQAAHQQIRQQFHFQNPFLFGSS